MILLLLIDIINITNLAKKAALNTKAVEVVNKIPDITKLAINAALNPKATEIEN